MKNKTKIIIVALALIVVIAVSIFFLSYKSRSCKSLYNKIENDLEKNNYCTQDSDCDVIMLGGEYVEFGCYHYINKNVDKNLIYAKMNEYDKACNAMIDFCAYAPNATCVSGKCVSIEQ